MDKVKVLIVEDEDIVAFDIENALISLGFFVLKSAKNHDEAMDRVTDTLPDIILMDINLNKSKKDGIDTVKDIQKNYNIPVVYLTAFSDDITVDRAIETNPSGYIIKPFKREELKTTIKIALTKNNQSNQYSKDLHSLGSNYFYNLESNQLFHNDIPIKLSKNEKLLLNLLIHSRGNLVTFEDIEENIWSDTVIADSTLRSLIYRLRCKIDPSIIQTITGFGCKLVY